MKRYVYIFFVMFISISAFAEEAVYYCDNFLYAGIYRKERSGIFIKSEEVDKYIVTNYMVYNVTSRDMKFVFPENTDRIISAIIFEESYDPAKRMMLVNIPDQYWTDDYKINNRSSSLIINNKNIDERELVDSLIFIVRYESETHSLKPYKQEIWKCRRNGTGLELVTAIMSIDTYRIDVKNKKIIVIRQDGPQTKIDVYDL